MADDVIAMMTKEAKAKHREEIERQFGEFKRSLEGLATRMYVDHFLDDIRNSSEYTIMTDLANRLEKVFLEKYKT